MYRRSALLLATLAISACVRTGATEKLSSEAYRTAKDELVALVNEKDARAALNHLRERTSADSAYARSCHLLAHDVGHAALKRYGSFADAMEHQQEICNSGYLHGIIEETFLHTDDIERSIREVCGDPASRSFRSWECFHGVGHGVMYRTDNDLPASLALCDTYENVFARRSCINGVFMENFNTDEKLHPSRFLDPADPFFPCATQRAGDKTDCYLYAPVYYLSLNPERYAQALRWCDSAETGYREACTAGVGAQTMKENILDPAFTVQRCGEGAMWQRTPCINGMVNLAINHFGALEPVERMCDTLPLFDANTCREIVEGRRPEFSGE